ncbi:DUF1684 domain-containing protein [Demequina sp. NBRC 110056]|uniref:DUF1684 domain-containing protein n=1 Tax=Demequina sp. NBRC 110056 TaxID=1570345 RepID=UPI000A011862|nr:DUF1684 domain-containing protein [Demequina sp. NBRC 110056]
MDSWDVRDWRARVDALYAEVRAQERPERAHRLWVMGRDRLLVKHPASPVPPEHREGFGAQYAPYDPEYRFVVPVTAAEPERREVPTPTDGVVPFERIGRVELPELGGLDVWWLDSYGGGVFLPLRDASPTSYGGGRYVLDTVKGADLGGARDALVVDLNFAYQPSCAYSSDWVCPLPGPGNTLTAAVEAGERYVALD